MFRTALFILVSSFCMQLLASPPKGSDTTNGEDLADVAIKLAKKDALKGWTYERLLGSSDAVLIGVFTDKQQVEFTKSDVASLHGNENVVALESRFKVLAVLKPDKKWGRSPKSVRVLHFSWATEGFRSKSPILLDFSTPIFRQSSIDVVGPKGIARHSVGQPVVLYSDRPFLMFLSARPDGRYQPVTGQYFPRLAFRRIVDPF